MNTHEEKNMETTPDVEATVVFPLRETAQGRKDLLLGEKTAKIGVGCLTGFGGKVEPTETIREAASRELYEESGLSAPPESLRYLGRMTFHNQKIAEGAAVSSFVVRVHFFISDAWYGKVRERDYGMINLAWHPLKKLPYERMMAADKVFLPQMLRLTIHERLIGSAYYIGDQQHLDPNRPVETAVLPFAADIF